MSETYYLVRALEPQSGKFSSIQTVFQTIEEFKGFDAQSTDLLILANVGRMSVRQCEKIKKFVNQGGHLLFTLGDQIEINSFHSQWGELLPVRLRDLHQERPPISMSPFYPDQSFLTGFSTDEYPLLSIPKFHKFFMVQNNPSKTLEVPIRFLSGAPALVVSPYGRGKVALWTSAVDLEWNDFAIQTTFVPFVQSLTQYLVGSDDQERIHFAELGHKIEFPIHPQSQTLKIEGFNQQLFQFIPSVQERKEGRVFLKEFKIPGPYKVTELTKDSDIVRISTLICRAPKSESDLKKIDQQKIRDLMPNLSIYVQSASKSISSSSRVVHKAQIDLSQFLIWAAMLMLFLEAYWTLR